MGLYDKRLKLTNMQIANNSVNRFGVSAAKHEELPFDGSLRQRLMSRYALLDIRKIFGLSYREWMAQDFCEMNRQMEQVSAILEEKKKALDNTTGKDK